MKKLQAPNWNAIILASVRAYFSESPTKISLCSKQPAFQHFPRAFNSRSRQRRRRGTNDCQPRTEITSESGVEIGRYVQMPTNVLLKNEVKSRVAALTASEFLLSVEQPFEKSCWPISVEFCCYRHQRSAGKAANADYSFFCCSLLLRISIQTKNCHTLVILFFAHQKPFLANRVFSCLEIIMCATTCLSHPKAWLWSTVFCRSKNSMSCACAKLSIVIFDWKKSSAARSLSHHRCCACLPHHWRPNIFQVYWQVGNTKFLLDHDEWSCCTDKRQSQLSAL